MVTPFTTDHAGGARRAALACTAALAAILTGCGGSGPSPEPAPAPAFRTTIGGDGQFNRVAETGSAERATVAASPDQVFAALLAVLPARFEIPVATQDAAQRRAGNPAVVVKRRLAGQPATRFFDCGMDEMAEARAATWELTIALSVQVSAGPSAETSVVQAVAQASATNRGLRKPPAECSSTGQLERQVVEQIRQALAK